MKDTHDTKITLTLATTDMGIAHGVVFSQGGKMLLLGKFFPGTPLEKVTYGTKQGEHLDIKTPEEFFDVLSNFFTNLEGQVVENPADLVENTISS